jgi:site-specific recombinase XerC
MNPGSVHSAIAIAFRESGVNFGDRHHGGHALRFSLAQRMLDKSIPIPVISETLGHTEVNTTRTYVRIDLTHMMRCVLEVPETSDAFYTQRGGWLYD